MKYVTSVKNAIRTEVHAPLYMADSLENAKWSDLTVDKATNKVATKSDVTSVKQFLQVTNVEYHDIGDLEVYMVCRIKDVDTCEKVTVLGENSTSYVVELDDGTTVGVYKGCVKFVRVDGE